jgi:hypothetical protein
MHPAVKLVGKIIWWISSFQREMNDAVHATHAAAAIPIMFASIIIRGDAAAAAITDQTILIVRNH